MTSVCSDWKPPWALSGLNDLDERLTGTARETAEFEVIESRGGECCRGSLREVLFRNSAEVGAREILPHCGSRVRAPERGTRAATIRFRSTRAVVRGCCAG